MRLGVYRDAEGRALLLVGMSAKGRIGRRVGCSDPHRDHSGRLRRHSRDAAAWVSRYEPAVDEGGLRYIWLEARWLDRLKSYRGPGESYSEVILRLAAEG